MGTLHRRDAAGLALAGITLLAVAAAPARAGLPVDFAVDNGTSKVFFSKAGLKLKGKCVSDAPQIKALSTHTKHRPAVLRANSQSDLLETGGSEHHYFGVNKFHSGTDGVEFLSISNGLAALDSAVGQLLQVDRRRVLAIDWMAEADGDALGKDCLFGGTAQTAKKGSPQAVLFRANKGTKARTAFEDGAYKLRAKCDSSSGKPDLDLFAKAGISTSSTYIASQSDVNGDTLDEHGFGQAEDLSDGKVQLDLSGIADDEAAGQIVVNTSNPQYSIDWVASSSGELGRDCLFAGIVRRAGAGDNPQVTYSSFGPDPLGQFHLRAGLRLYAGCAAGPDLTLLAGSSVTASTAHWGIQGDANGDLTDAHYYGEADDLAPANVAVLNATEDENAIGQIVYAAPGGTYTSVDFVADEEGIFGHADCAAAGVSDTAG